MLKFTKADDRKKAAKDKVTMVIFGPAGAGKTTQARTLDPKKTLFIDFEAGTLALGKDWAKDNVFDVRGVAGTVGCHPWELARAAALYIGGPDPSDATGSYSKAMYDQGILRACAKIKKPVLIKRGFGTTLQEFVQAAEFVLAGGNENVILCERGIRTFETGTRFTLDLCGVAWLQEYTNLPIILDPSHAMGYAYGVNPLARACVAMGIDGLLIEAHPNPKVAKSDASQQLNYEEFKQLQKDLQAVAASVGYKMI